MKGIESNEIKMKPKCSEETNKVSFDIIISETTLNNKIEVEKEERMKVSVGSEFVIVYGNQMRVEENGEIIIGEGNAIGL